MVHTPFESRIRFTDPFEENDPGTFLTNAWALFPPHSLFSSSTWKCSKHFF
jgi:hypothetical protein